jgi:hypothetical protein
MDCDEVNRLKLIDFKLLTKSDKRPVGVTHEYVECIVVDKFNNCTIYGFDDHTLGVWCIGYFSDRVECAQKFYLGGKCDKVKLALDMFQYLMVVCNEVLDLKSVVIGCNVSKAVAIMNDDVLILRHKRLISDIVRYIDECNMNVLWLDKNKNACNPRIYDKYFNPVFYSCEYYLMN